MNLAALEARFVRYEDKVETWRVVDRQPGPGETAADVPSHEVTGPKTYSVPVASFAEAQGVWFLCPLCFEKNGGNVGTHWCEVTFAGRGALDHQGSHGSDGRPTRWNASGTSLADLTTTPSILLGGGCAWHGYITNGDAK